MVEMTGHQIASCAMCWVALAFSSVSYQKQASVDDIDETLYQEGAGVDDPPARRLTHL